MHLLWQPPSPEDCNGVITEYTIAFKEAVSLKPPVVPGPSLIPAPPWLVTLPASESSYMIVGLNHSTAYEVQLRAHNKAGPGPFSPPLVCRTLAFETGRTVQNTIYLLSTGSSSQLCFPYVDFTTNH